MDALLERTRETTNDDFNSADRILYRYWNRGGVFSTVSNLKMLHRQSHRREMHSPSTIGSDRESLCICQDWTGLIPQHPWRCDVLFIFKKILGRVRSEPVWL